MPFRWADFAVAASIFIAGVLTLLPAIQRSRERMNQAGCVFNLQQLGNSLAQYASLQPVLAVSAVAPIRHPRGDVRGDAARRGRAQRPVAARLSRATGRVRTSGKSSPASSRSTRSGEPIPKLIAGCSAGIMRTTSATAMRPGRPCPLEFGISSRHPGHWPTQPDHENFPTIRDGNSPNHGRRGQNVLFGDGSVGGSTPAASAPHDPDILSQQRPAAAPGRPSCTTRCWCRARCRSTADEASA